MPEMNGLELCKQLQDSDIKIVFISSHQNYEYFRYAIQYRVEDYLLKPIKSGDILNCFGKIRQQLDEKYAITQETPVTYYDQVISKVKEYIKENYKEASLEDAAVQVSLSPSYLSRIFKEKCGMGFSDYLAKPINGILFEAMLLRYLPKERIEYMIDPDEISEMDGFRILGQKKKQRLIVSTDNVVDLPNDVIRQLGIPVMHYFVNTEYGHYEDMVEIHSDSLLSYIEKDQYAKSEAPTVGEYETFFGNLLEEAEQVLHISIASGSGKGFENASQAAAGFSHVQVFDSGHLSSGTGLMVMHAANMVLKNKDLDEVLQSLEAIQPKIQTSFILDSSKQLYRSGLLNKQVWKMTEMLQCHPVLALHKKKIVPAAIFFGNTQDVYKKYIHAQMARWSPIDQKVLFITSAGCSKETKDMILEEVQKYKKFDQIYMQEASAAITSNCGAGCFGLIYMLQ